MKRQELDFSKKLRRKKGSSLRRFLEKNNIEYECSICKNPCIWMKEHLVLEVDHIDSDWSNNNLENLRYLCPYCHSQETYKKLKIKNKKYFCENCTEIEVVRTSKYCKKCYTNITSQNTSNRFNIDWPEDSKLQEMVLKMPLVVIGKKLNVSANAIKKRCITRNISLLPKNYFSGKIWKDIYNE